MLETVLAYHERTKHGYRRFARSPGYLDWDTQPHPFRRFDGAEEVPLALDVAGDALRYDDLFLESTRAPAPLDAAGVSDLFLHSLATSAWKQAGPSRWALRVNPSSGNLHPTEGYAVLPPVPGLTDDAGVFHYAPEAHLLERRCRLSPETWAAVSEGLPAGSFLVGLSSIHWREEWKYGERAFRYCQHDAGHALASIRLAAALRGWSVRILPAWSHEAAAALFGLDRDGDFPVAEEREEPEVVLAVTPAPIEVEPPAPSPATLDEVRGAVWTGRANPLSPDHHSWPLIDEAAAASRDPGGSEPEDVDWSGREYPAAPPGRSERYARRIIRQRRSAVSFDGRSAIPLEGFLRIMRHLLPGPHAPWDALTWSPRIHLLLFVHQVTGLDAGVYALVRDPEAIDRLRSATRSTFLWERPDGVPDGFPLNLLERGDVRILAAKLSCAQDIAGDSFFSLGMLADYGRSVRERGPAFYRRLFWESGVVGQVLYLEAEAEGARGTGIGCYFDDPVHEVAGITTDEFQSLYHFTVGVPVEDTRLSTLPAYPQSLVRARAE